MFFSRFISAALLFSASMVMASPAPAQALERRHNKDVLAVMNELRATVGVVAPKIQGIVAAKVAIDQTKVAPLIDELTLAVVKATTTLKALPVTANGHAEVKVSDKEIAQLCADIIIVVTKAAAPIATLPAVAAKLVNLDKAISDLVVTLQGLVHGLIFIVAGLLVEVAKQLIYLSWAFHETVKCLTGLGIVLPTGLPL